MENSETKGKRETGTRDMDGEKEYWREGEKFLREIRKEGRVREERRAGEGSGGRERSSGLRQNDREP